jgi:hypothetical protein
MRRATRAVVDIERPIARANTTVRKASVSPTAATASGPSRPTKKTSRIPKMPTTSKSESFGITPSWHGVQW